MLSLVSQVAVYALFWFQAYKKTIAIVFWIKGDLLVISVYAVLLLFFSRMSGGMKIGYLKAWEVFFSQAFATTCVNIITYAMVSLMSARLLNPQFFLLQLAVDLVWIGLWTAISQGLYTMLFPPRDMLLVYGERSPEDILNKFASRPDKYNICKCMQVSEGYDAICYEIKNRYDAMVLWDIPMEMRNKLLKYCFANSIRVYMMPKIPDVLIKGTTEMHIFDSPIYLIREYTLNVEQRFAKRLLDLFCSVILLVLTLPIMLITALLIKLYDRGPALYKQVRCTLDGKEFKILKFRSMKVDAEKEI